MIDDKDRLIARQCAFKGAIDAIMRSPTEFRTFEEIAAFVAAATDRFEAIINKRSGLVAAAKAAGAKPVSATECPAHHKAKMGNFGLFCPTKLRSGEWCKWQGPEGVEEEGGEIDFETV